MSLPFLTNSTPARVQKGLRVVADGMQELQYVEPEGEVKAWYNYADGGALVLIFIDLGLVEHGIPNSLIVGKDLMGVFQNQTLRNGG